MAWIAWYAQSRKRRQEQEDLEDEFTREEDPFDFGWVFWTVMALLVVALVGECIYVMARGPI